MAPRQPRLTPGVRAHYLIHSRACLRCDGCQLVTSWHQLIRREVIFKGLLSVVTADPLTLCRFVCGLGELCTSA